MVETGGARELFWASTMREVQLDIEVANERQSNDEQSRRWHTWHVAALPNAKKFPAFKDFVLAKETASTPKRRQSVEDQIAIARAWSAVANRRKR